MDWQGHNLHINDDVIHYYRNGNSGRTPLVFCHGFSDNGLCWYRVAERFTDQFDIYLLDARNHGQSSRGIASAQDMTQDVAAVITTLKLEPVIAVGHSMGAGTVAALAADSPQLVSKIVLEDPAWSDEIDTKNTKRLQERAAGFAKYLEMIPKLSDEQLLAMGRAQHPSWSLEDFPSWVQSKREVDVLALKGLNRTPWQRLVQRINCPSLLLYADETSDGIVQQKVVDQILSLNPRFQCKQITGAGHNLRREQFEAYVTAIEAFLN
jgi:pimeloyl-ACP methyl ester carboxylesterase